MEKWKEKFKRFTRLSPCFSKKAENLALSVAMTVAVFNFCRPHASLKIKATADAKAIERTRQWRRCLQTTFGAWKSC